MQIGIKMNLLYVVLSSLLLVISNNTLFAAEFSEKFQAPDEVIVKENLKKLQQFQRRQFFVPTPQEKDYCRTKKQEVLGEKAIQEDLISKGIFTVQAVEGLAEIAEIFTQLPTPQKRLTLLDLDGTIFFGGGLSCVMVASELCWATGWIGKYQTPTLAKDLFQLMSEYGFSSLAEFEEWGSLNFPTCASSYYSKDFKLGGRKRNPFHSQLNVLDPKVRGILEDWYAQGMDIFGFTARTTMGGENVYTQDSLKEAGINTSVLSNIPFANNELKLGEAGIYEDGIIYTDDKPKFGRGSAGILFIEAYIAKLKQYNSEIDLLEVVMIDDRVDIFETIASLENIEELQRLEQKYSIKINVKGFQPFEHLWMWPFNQWNRNEYYVPALNREALPVEALREFLQTFKKIEHK